MSEESESYEYIRATIDDGELTWKYKAKEADRAGSMTHDEDVSDWDDDDIRDLTVSMLTVPKEQRDLIEIHWS